MKKLTLTVLLDQDGTDVELEVSTMLADQMRAELEVKKRGLELQQSPVHFLSAMAWCALARTGQITDKFEDFAGRCYQVSKNEEDPDVDPSQPTASTGSVSP